MKSLSSISPPDEPYSQSMKVTNPIEWVELSKKIRFFSKCLQLTSSGEKSYSVFKIKTNKIIIKINNVTRKIK